MSAETVIPLRTRRAVRIVFLFIFCGILAGLITRDYQHRKEQAWLEEWTRKQKGLPPSGGKKFEQRMVIDVPSFRQGDPQWAQDPLGPSATDTLGSAGCAVASCAMVLASYGIDTDPRRLNDFLGNNNGFTPQAWLIWEVAAMLGPEKVKFAYENDPSYQLIDENLERGNPVIVRLRYPPPGQITHFVVICGKDGYDYLIRDPGAGASRGVYPLREFGSKIEALRFYEFVNRS